MREMAESSSSTSSECKRPAAAPLEAPISSTPKRRKLMEEGEEDSSDSTRLPETELRSGTALFGGLTMIDIAPPTESVSGDLPSSSCSDLALSRFKVSPSGMMRMEERVEDPEPEIVFEQEEVWSSTETETSTCITANFSFSTENIPHLNHLSDSESSEFKTKEPSPPASNRRMPRVTKMPPQTEIEEFFSAAEKYEAERFTEKYNYDFVKDKPLEGRYRWSPLKP